MSSEQSPKSRVGEWRVAGTVTLVMVVLLWAFWAWSTDKLTAYQGGQAHERQQTAEQNAGNPGERDQRLCISLPRGQAEACVTQPPQSETDAQRAESDLRAQQDMAAFALGMLYATGGTLVLTALGVVLLFFTLRSTYATLREAERTTEQAKIAAHAAVKQAHIAENADRAWLYVEIKRHSSPKADDPNHVGTRYVGEVIFTVTNFGRQPAIVRSVLAEYYCLPAGKSFVPDPQAPQAAQLRNNVTATLLTADGRLLKSREREPEGWPTVGDEIVIEAGRQVTISGTFVFSASPAYELPSDDMPHTRRLFLCHIAYEGVGPTVCHTCIYKALPGAGVSDVDDKLLRSRYNYRH